MNKTIIYLILSILLIGICYDSIIQLVLVYIFGYCFGYFIYEILRKSLKKKRLKNSFLHIIRNMASKEEVTTPENKLAEMTINENLEKKFLHNLELQLNLTFGDSIVSCMIREKGMAFSLETFPLQSETAKKLLKVVDDHITEYFFSSDGGLAKLGWCTKYLMESTVCFSKNAEDKFKKTQIIEFYWFRIENTFCQCFHCFCFKKKVN